MKYLLCIKLLQGLKMISQMIGKGMGVATENESKSQDQVMKMFENL